MGVLEGKVAVIAGGTSGIGARTAELFVEEGATVVIAGRRRDAGEALAQRLGKAASFVQTDVAHEAELKALIDGAAARFGRLDCLFNNAGYGILQRSIVNLDIAEYDQMMAVVLRAVMLGMKFAAPIMIRQRSGCILNTGSIAAYRASLSAQTYSVAKAAVLHPGRGVFFSRGSPPRPRRRSATWRDRLSASPRGPRATRAPGRCPAGRASPGGPGRS